MRSFRYAVLLMLVATGEASVAYGNDLYRGQTLVTGMREETRLPGVLTCFMDVLAKASGDARLTTDLKTAKVAAEAPAFVTDYSYRDRLAGIPIRDEQGTRDRPYFLTVTFDKAKVDAALKELGSKPWTVARPRVGLFLTVNNDARVYVLARDGQFGRDQREALADASWQIGMPLVLPSEADLAKDGITTATLPKTEPARLERLAKTIGADVALIGSLVWNRGTLGWQADWRLLAGKEAQGWMVKDVNFDDAFRNALRGSALMLSGNGRPE